MREVSESEFMKFAVFDTDRELYQSWENGVFVNGVDMNLMLTHIALKLFSTQDRGNVVDYVSEIVVAKLNGTLKWVS